jgi:peroxiredoxin Q/BCP
MLKTLCVISLLVLSVLTLGLSKGDKAPEFSSKNQDGKVVHLSDFSGKPVILYFYPKDDTPGCTKEACAFRDEYSKIKNQGAVVLGVSRQDEQSHRAFRAKHHLPFDLLSDGEGKLAALYGVESMPVVGYLKRQSVLIGADGKVIRFYPDVNPGTHTAEVLHDLQDYAIHANKPSA